MKNDHVAGDTVGVRIAKVDRTNISMRFLSCKVLEKTNGKFRLYSSSGVLNTTSAHTDLHDMRNIRFQQLENLNPSTMEKVALTKTSRNNSQFKNLPNQISICKCKGKCTTKKCACKKEELPCSTNKSATQIIYNV